MEASKSAQLCSCERCLERIHVDLLLTLYSGNDLFKWMHESVSKFGILILLLRWKIWCARNTLICDNLHMSAAVIVNQIKALHSEASHAFNCAVSGGRFHGINQTMVLQLLMLMAVPLLIQVWHGLVDFVWDHGGFFLHGFYDSVGQSKIMHMELIDLIHNIYPCVWSWVFRRVHYYTDSLTT